MSNYPQFILAKANRDTLEALSLAIDLADVLQRYQDDYGESYVPSSEQRERERERCEDCRQFCRLAKQSSEK
jgi:hypothetical protein